MVFNEKIGERVILLIRCVIRDCLLTIRHKKISVKERTTISFVGVGVFLVL
ncbi:hypothetical protein HMPREF1987_00177 [Peptostreptococcaceae bacterium oral taxon 113 str. W5053]|nr:hypothetical protein HMPREF1987_00177 [Peptostreptococcaceae bacterium oral taxon 113 str. W5053]